VEDARPGVQSVATAPGRELRRSCNGVQRQNLTVPEHPGEVVSNSGTDFSGHLVPQDEATGATIGSLSGALVRGTDDFAGPVTFGGACNGLQSRC
jgi:hypothetical protein